MRNEQNGTMMNVTDKTQECMQDAVCWAQHKASGDTIVKTNTLGADARMCFKGTARS